jgi:cytochrome b561
MGRVVDLAARLGHLALYALLLAVPVVGIATLFAGGESLSIFGVVDIPSPWVKDRAFEHSLEDIHEILAHSLIALVAVHAAAAIVHHRVYRDDTLKRMLPPGVSAEGAIGVRVCRGGTGPQSIIPPLLHVA